MFVKVNKERYTEAVKDLNECKGDINKIRSMLDKYCAPGCIIHHASRGDMNLDQTAQYYAEMWSAFPDSIVSIDDMVAEENKIAVRAKVKGTHKGAYMEIPATGKQIVLRAWQILRMVEGKTVEMWELPDGLGIMIQLGVVPGAIPVK